MNKVSLSKILSLVFFTCFISFANISCANNVDENQPEQTVNSSIVISTTSTTATIGDTISISVDFSNFASNPTTVDVYVEESMTVVKDNVSVSDGKMSLDTSAFEAGTYHLYVKSGNIKSNSLEVVLSENQLKAPTDVTVESSSKTNYVTVKWTNTGAAKYWVYYNSSNDTSTATCASKYETSGTYGCDIALSSSGTYYFWVKSADGYSSSSNTSVFSSVVSYSFTYVSLSVPTGIEVSVSTKTNYVTVKWTNTGAAKYWVYYNSINDTSTATCASKYETSGTYGCDILLSSTGTYYFWVKSADGYNSTSATSDFSTAATYTFTYTKLSAPTNV